MLIFLRAKIFHRVFFWTDEVEIEYKSLSLISFKIIHCSALIVATTTTTISLSTVYDDRPARNFAHLSVDHVW